MSEPGLIEVPDPPELSREEKAFLLELAAGALRDHLEGREASAAAVPPQVMASRELRQKTGIFVSLYSEEGLRGCIGQVQPDEPLWQVLRRMSVAAGTRDPRFTPVDREELEDLAIEISVLGPLVAVSPEMRDREGRFCVPGIHGVQIRLGEQAGILLPQVAEKYGWDARRLLDETARKAGLEEGIWLDPSCELWLFRGRRFEGTASGPVS